RDWSSDVCSSDLFQGKSRCKEPVDIRKVHEEEYRCAYQRQIECPYADTQPYDTLIFVFRTFRGPSLTLTDEGRNRRFSVRKNGRCNRLTKLNSVGLTLGNLM